MKHALFLILFLVGSIFAQDAFQKFEKGVQLYDEGFYAEAYKIFNEIKESKELSYESLSQIHFLLGDIKFKLNEFVDATFDLENYVIKFPYDRNVDLALLRLGQIYFTTGNYDNSEKFLLKFLQNHIDSKYLGLAHYWIGEVYSITNKLDKAEFHYLEAIKNSQTNSKLDHTLFSLGFLYEKLGLYDKAEYYYEKLLLDFPDSELIAHGLVRAAFTLYTNGSFNKAIKKLTDPRIRSLSQATLGEAYYILANSYYKIGLFYEAQVEFQNVVSRFPNSPMVRPAKYGLGWSYYQQNKFEQAHKIFLELSTVKDSLGERSLYWLGFISRNLQNNEKAIKEFLEYLKQYPGSSYESKAKLQIGIINYELKRFQDAEKFLIEVVEDTTDDISRSSAALILGTISLEKKNFRTAKASYELAVSLIDPSSEDYGDALLGLAISNFYLNNYDVAITILKQILDRKNIREIDKVRFYLGESYFIKKQYGDATKEYEEVIKKTNDDDLKELSLYGLIYSHFNLKNFSNVIQLSTRFLEDFTYSNHYSEVKLRLADSYYAQKNFKKAVDLYREYFSDSEAKGNDYVSYQLAQALYRSGNLDGSIEELRRFLLQYPSSRYADEVQFLIGWIRFKQAKYEASIEEYRKVIQNFSNSPIVPLAYYSIGDAYFNLGKYDLAIENYKLVLDKYPQSPFVIDAINGIQYAYVAQNKIDQAAQTITEFVLANPGNRHLDKLLIKKGDLYLSQRRFQEAITSYREFISFFPSSSLVPIAYFSIAKSFSQIQAYDDAIYNLQFIVRNFPNDELVDDAILEIGNIYRIKQDFEKAIQQFEALIKNYPNSNLIPEAYYWLGKCYADLGETSKAKIHFDQVTTKFKDSGFYSRSIFELAKIEMNSRPDSALALFRKVVELRNDEFGAESQYLIGEILFQNKNYKDAITEFLKLRYAFAGHFDWLVKGLFRVAEIYELQKDKKKAREFYNEVLKLDPKGELGTKAKRKLRTLR